MHAISEVCVCFRLGGCFVSLRARVCMSDNVTVDDERGGTDEAEV